MNALRHGLTAKSLVLSTESQEQFDELLKHYVEFYGPNNIVELDLVHDMVAARWRLSRTRALETVTLDQRMAQRDEQKISYHRDIEEWARLALTVSDLAGGKSLDLLLRYETTYSRAFDRAQKALEKMQKTRSQSTTTEELRNEPPPPAAEPVSSLQITPGSPEFAKMITKLSPEALIRYLPNLQSQCEASEPQPISTE